MLKENRREKILTLLKEEGSVKTIELSKLFNTSRQTIHKDIDYLATVENIKKVYGGAVIKSKTNEPSLSVRRVEHITEKEHIGRIASEQIEENDTLFLDVGTTIAKLVPYLKSFQKLTVITNSIENAYLLGEAEHLDVIMIGGKIRSRDLASSSTHAVERLKNIYVDKAFLSVGGISVTAGYTDFHFDDSEVRRIMIQNATKSFILADASKVGVVTIAKFADLDEIDTLISYDIKDAELLSTFKELDLHYINAKNE